MSFWTSFEALKDWHMNTYHKHAKQWAVRTGAIMEDIITNFELKSTRLIRVCPCCGHAEDKAYDLHQDLQRLTPDRQARDAEGVADLLRLLGPLSTGEVAGAARRGATSPPGWRCWPTPAGWSQVRMGGEERWTAVEDVARLRDGLGVPVPPGTPEVFTEPVDDPLADLVARFARTHGPFTPADVAARLGLGVAVAAADAVPAGRPGPGAGGRVPARRRGHRVVRRRGAAPAAAPVAGRAAQGGRAGRAGDAGPVPAGVAERLGGRRPGPARRRRRGRRGRPARRLRGARLRPRAARARQPGRRLRARDARRADRDRRGAVGRPRHAARHRRLGVAAPRRQRPT